MHKHLFLLVFLLIGGLNLLKAQELADYGKYTAHPDYAEGIILNEQGEQLKGLIKVDKPEMLHRKVSFVHVGGKRKKYGPDDLVSFQLGRSFYQSDGRRFMELVEDGQKAALYQIRKTSSNYVPLRGPGFGGPPQRIYGGEKEETDYFIRKKGEEAYRKVDASRFHKVYANYFKDCPRLADRIRFKELNYSHIKIIMQIYNNHCAE